MGLDKLAAKASFFLFNYSGVLTGDIADFTSDILKFVPTIGGFVEVGEALAGSDLSELWATGRGLFTDS